jgi:two-component system, cell cycle response regulator DivK
MTPDVEVNSDASQPYILIVEDDLENYTQIARMLGRAGFKRVEWKSSGSSIIQLLSVVDEPPALILLDIGLPTEDGYEVLQRLRSLEQLRKARIVAVTGRSTIEEMRKVRAAGFDGFLGKPLDSERFPQQVRRILGGERVWEQS